jgi:hypothetical protein
MLFQQISSWRSVSQKMHFTCSYTFYQWLAVCADHEKFMPSFCTYSKEICLISTFYQGNLTNGLPSFVAKPFVLDIPWHSLFGTSEETSTGIKQTVANTESPAPQGPNPANSLPALFPSHSPTLTNRQQHYPIRQCLLANCQGLACPLSPTLNWGHGCFSPAHAAPGVISLSLLPFNPGPPDSDAQPALLWYSIAAQAENVGTFCLHKSQRASTFAQRLPQTNPRLASSDLLVSSLSGSSLSTLPSTSLPCIVPV